MRPLIKKIAIVVLLVVVAPVGLLWVGATAFGDDSDSGRTTTALDHAVLSGDLQAMVDRHQAMMEKMPASLTPEMLAMMDGDPMWQQMRTGEFARLMEAHQRQLDRMLGENG